VRVLLDPHILLWALDDSKRLAGRAREVLLDPDNECWVSAASVWEIAIEVGLGKHRLSFPLRRLESAIRESGFDGLDITARHALALEGIETAHADPFDRLLLAQCEVETLRLLTTDRNLTPLPIAVPLWATGADLSLPRRYRRASRGDRK
jgi:PIN domain nuclease of toxin-antitoxin system